MRKTSLLDGRAFWIRPPKATAPLDLVNELIRETYRGKSDHLERITGRSPSSIRQAIVNAKRFVLDESMSAFMADLATVPFKVAMERRPDVLDSLRHSARLPFPKMFIQVEGRAFRKGLLKVADSLTDVFGHPLVSAESEELVSDIGWLLETDSADPDLVWITEFFQVDGKPTTLPFRFAYRTDDRGFHPRLKLDTKAGMFAHGIVNNNDPNIGVQYSPMALQMSGPKSTHWVDVDDNEHGESYEVHRLVPEFGGIVRYALGLLATLNDIPTIETHSRPAKSYLGGGQIRKYLDHTTLTLSLPAKKSTRVLAMQLIAKARKGWHQVRPHWRINHPRLGQKFCDARSQHIWLEADESGHANCKHCDARRVWIVLPDGRGDPTISVRTHQYALTHRGASMTRPSVYDAE